MGGWIDATEGKARIIHQELLAARELAVRMGKDPDEISSPYFELLAKLYRDDFPIAFLADHSDLVARFTGPGVLNHEPPVSLVTGAFSKLRTQIQHIAKSIAGLEEKKVRWPEHLDPNLSGLAYGSLVVGMRVPRPGELDSQGQLVLEGVTDGLYQAVRDAVRSLPIIPRLIEDDGVSEEVYSLFPDPAVRDTIMLAAHKLAPSSKNKGITNLYLSCPGEDELAPTALTKKSREILRKSLNEPSWKRSSGTDSFEGVVREIDLDAFRFEIRGARYLRGIRCMYDERYKTKVKEILDCTVRVSGSYEAAADKQPSLVAVESIEILRRADEQLDLLGH
ncbi:hypothetical protein [Cyanobium sp. ATX 6F1]|uniref:hypothetical protein n=1 Tax=unclassified Cyanobium TaxID=2627006 RepID=UPI0020CBCF44|nr:hypothetical protein [Cyanobium sp. ATX 6F1]MCP9915238.1 hypothetical protein [Cyanobium sp. ATX 6F1]